MFLKPPFNHCPMTRNWHSTTPRQVTLTMMMKITVPWLKIKDFWTTRVKITETQTTMHHNQTTTSIVLAGDLLFLCVHLRDPNQGFPVKVLVLGALELGKSTMFHQVTGMFHHPPDDAWRIRYSNVVVKCIFDAIFSLFSHAEGNSLLLTEEGEVSLKFLSNLVSNGPTFITPEMGKHLKTLWSEPAIQEAFLNSNQFYSIETLPYFMHNIDRMIGNAYVPTWKDCLHSRLKTTGIFDSEFNFGG
eukprot:TRINITY_DN28_c1_g1_i7.p1 TRINITY_DN28_c1_g1~~TRINITY_DN28_c1_g1_i7.p1  ORF type:complete len:245 (-),score=37.22 TRINITY_DN28_c1_g1_i7:1503-2237(-)